CLLRAILLNGVLAGTRRLIRHLHHVYIERARERNAVVIDTAPEKLLKELPGDFRAVTLGEPGEVLTDQGRIAHSDILVAEAHTAKPRGRRVGGHGNCVSGLRGTSLGT